MLALCEGSKIPRFALRILNPPQNVTPLTRSEPLPWNQQGGSMSRISRLDRTQVSPEIAAGFDKVFAQRGNVPNMFRVMAHRPEIFATMQAHFAAVLSTGTVPTKLKELIIVRTSQINSTLYCLASHTILARNLGWSDDQLSNLSAWQTREDFTPAE